jgi:epoxide hydrolase
MPLAYAQDLALYWADCYDWRQRESALNRFDQFVTEIDGLDIHFIHQRSPHADAFPIILTHGWPGSIVEFHKVIGPLSDPTSYGGRAQDAFHVVCPSLPGFGFSGKPSTTGWGVGKVAGAWEDLMVRLGYQRYGAQGGDWGAGVTTAMGRNVGHCVAIHLNMPLARAPAHQKDPSREEKQALAAAAQYRRWDSGYLKQQSTRPQTLGYGLVDSPVGQLTWIVEKFWAWTDSDGHPENVLSRDELLDNVMIYWVTGSAASSARMYWESSAGYMTSPTAVRLPTGIAEFPKEVLPTPRAWCEERYNITRWSKMPKGGHFAAFEQPELFVDDLRAFFATVR